MLNQPVVEIPRPEYPRPQLQRKEWINLNGAWSFEFDPGDSGLERGLLTQDFSRRITVPFAPEAEMSGIGDVDFHEAVWYRKTVRLPEEWKEKRLLLHFGAVDHDATVWVNGDMVVRHRGGFTSFSADITSAVGDSDTAVIVVRARDRKNEWQARGKQATWYANSNCFYTRTTGIWQTVWLEPVDRTHVTRVDCTPNVSHSQFDMKVPVSVNTAGCILRAKLYDQEKVTVLSSAETPLDGDFTPTFSLAVPEGSAHLWNPGEPYLYKIVVEIVDSTGEVIDVVDSYAGLRSITIEGRHFLINGKEVFQRLVLDQGYWAESLMTAPTDAALIKDIELGMKAGFNGARLHQKVFEERYLYHADRLGYLVWGEFGDWGISSGIGPVGNNQHPTASFITQWSEAILRDYSHPSIIGWCPMNETYQKLTDQIPQLEDVMRGMFLVTRALDSSRPVLDASGYAHLVPESDIYDSHNYAQDPEEFDRQMGDKEHCYVNKLNGEKMSLPYGGQPYFCSEYGGIWWNADLAGISLKDDSEEESWGYGERITSLEEFYKRFDGLTEVLAKRPWMFGYCYTQLTDVFQEQNGIYGFDRSEKFDTARIRHSQIELTRKYRE